MKILDQYKHYLNVRDNWSTFPDDIVSKLATEMCEDIDNQIIKEIIGMANENSRSI